MEVAWKKRFQRSGAGASCAATGRVTARSRGVNLLRRKQPSSQKRRGWHTSGGLRTSQMAGPFLIVVASNNRDKENSGGGYGKAEDPGVCGEHAERFFEIGRAHV